MCDVDALYSPIRSWQAEVMTSQNGIVFSLTKKTGGQDLARTPWSACPRCGKTVIELPALSREDHATRICGDCGIAQALRDHRRGYHY